MTRKTVLAWAAAMSVTAIAFGAAERDLDSPIGRDGCQLS